MVAEKYFGKFLAAGVIAGVLSILSALPFVQYWYSAGLKLSFVLSVLTLIIGIMIRKKYRFHESSIWSNIIIILGSIMTVISMRVFL